MKKLLIYLGILFIHFVADFMCQTHWQAQNKSTRNDALFEHTLTYSAIWVIPMLFLLSPFNMALFCLITLFCHTITDYFTSRLNKRLWEAKNVHWFFVSVGFDQMLHFTQLFLTYYVLKE